MEPTESSIETLTEEMNKTSLYSFFFLFLSPLLKFSLRIDMQPELKKFDCIEMKEDEIEEYILSHPHREANILAKIELLGSYDTLNSERDAKTIILQAIALAEKTIGNNQQLCVKYDCLFSRFFYYRCDYASVD